MADPVNQGLKVEMRYGFPCEIKETHVEGKVNNVWAGTKGVLGAVVASPVLAVGGALSLVYDISMLAYDKYKGNRAPRENTVDRAKAAWKRVIGDRFHTQSAYATEGPGSEAAARGTGAHGLGASLVPPGNEDAIKELFDSGKRRIDSDENVQFILNTNEGRVYLKIEGKDGAYTYESFSIVDPGTGNRIEDPALLMRSAKTVAAVYKDGKAKDCFEKHDLVVFHVRYADGAPSLIMRGFNYACWDKDKNNNDAIKWNSTLPLWGNNVEPGSSLDGQTIEFNKELTDAVARIFKLKDDASLWNPWNSKANRTGNVNDGKNPANGLPGLNAVQDPAAVAAAAAKSVPDGYREFSIPGDGNCQFGAFVAQEMINEGKIGKGAEGISSCSTAMKAEYDRRVLAKRAAVGNSLKEHLLHLADNLSMSCQNHEKNKAILIQYLNTINNTITQELKRPGNSDVRNERLQEIKDLLTPGLLNLEKYNGNNLKRIISGYVTLIKESATTKDLSTIPGAWGDELSLVELSIVGYAGPTSRYDVNSSQGTPLDRTPEDWKSAKAAYEAIRIYVKYDGSHYSLLLKE